MSTRATIARQTEGDAFVGRYSHWDGYPSGVGIGILRALNHFGLTEGKKVLLDDHTAGWSNVASCDWTQEIGFIEGIDAPNRDRPQCYCHGDRNEEEWAVDSVEDKDNVFIEWAYVFNESDDTLIVYKHEGQSWNLMRTIDLTNISEAMSAMMETCPLNGVAA